MKLFYQDCYENAYREITVDELKKIKANFNNDCEIIVLVSECCTNNELYFAYEQFEC